jgi:hypothetical protein
MGSSPKPPKTPKANYERDILSYVRGLEKGFPSVYELESEYRPKWQDLNLLDISKFGLGAMGLAPQFTEKALGQLGAAREAELGQMTGQAGLTRGLMAGLSPEQASAVQQAQQESQRAYASAQGVTPQEQRMYQQTAREGAQAAGRVGGNAAIASEIMGREDIMARKRAEAAQAGQQAFNLAGQFYTQPGLQLLGSQPLSYQSGQQMMGLGLEAIGSGRPQMIDIGTPFNLGAAERQNQFQAAQSKYAADVQTRNANTQAAASTAATIATVAAMSASDKRVKKDIKKIGKTNGGLPIYTFKYKGEDKTQMGVMAQDVEKKQPKAAATAPSGIKMVNYSKIK